MQINLTSDQADTLRDCISDVDPAPLVLNVGNGHSGFGLYAWEEEYPEEGATLIAPMEPLAGAQPASAAPSEPIRATLPTPLAAVWRHAVLGAEREPSKLVALDARTILAVDELFASPAAPHPATPDAIAMEVLRELVEATNAYYANQSLGATLQATGDRHRAAWVRARDLVARSPAPSGGAQGDSVDSSARAGAVLQAREV
jgi:hypothetical protein